MLRTDQSDGAVDNKNLLVVPFSKPVTLGNISEIALSGQAIDPLTGHHVPETIPILSATIDPSHPKTVTILTGEIVPKEAHLTFGAGSLTGVAKSETATVPRGVSAVEFTLAGRPFKPTDLGYFSSNAYPSSPPATEPSIPAPDESMMRRQLTRFLSREVTMHVITTAQLTTALKQFRDPTLTAIVPSPLLRAALISLTGTVAAPAIQDVLSDLPDGTHRYTSIDFRAPGDTRPTYTTVNNDGHIAIGFERDNTAEPFQVLGVILAHETLHQDTVNGWYEENINNIVMTLVQTQFYHVDPGLAALKTPQLRVYNDQLLGMLNSGRLNFPGVGFFAAPQVQTGSSSPRPVIYPGSPYAFTSVIQFGNVISKVLNDFGFFGIPDRATPGNPTLQAELSRITHTRARSANFDQGTERLLDEKQKIVDEHTAMQLAKLLKLTIG